MAKSKPCARNAVGCNFMTFGSYAQPAASRDSEARRQNYATLDDVAINDSSGVHSRCVRILSFSHPRFTSASHHHVG